jgi:hypothetical protein
MIDPQPISPLISLEEAAKVPATDTFMDPEEKGWPQDPPPGSHGAGNFFGLAVCMGESGSHLPFCVHQSFHKEEFRLPG